MTITRTHDLDTAAAVAEELSQRIRNILALLHAVDDHAAELTLGLLPFGSRSGLAAYGIIVADKGEPGDPVEVRLTPFGREVIALCALEQAPREVRESIDALDEARARRDSELSASRLRAVGPKTRR